jgi:hypothetical protein
MSVAVRQFDVDVAEREINKYLSRGYSISQVTSTDGHVNIGRTVTYALATGGLSLLFGGSRSGGKVTVIFESPNSTKEPVRKFNWDHASIAIGVVGLVTLIGSLSKLIQHG